MGRFSLVELRLLQLSSQLPILHPQFLFALFEFVFQVLHLLQNPSIELIFELGGLLILRESLCMLLVDDDFLLK